MESILNKVFDLFQDPRGLNSKHNQANEYPIPLQKTSCCPPVVQTEEEMAESFSQLLIGIASGK